MESRKIAQRPGHLSLPVSLAVGLQPPPYAKRLNACLITPLQ